MNLLDIAKRNNNDKEVGIIEDSINAYTAIKVLDTKAIKGTYFDTFRRTSMPHGSFAHLGEGVDASQSEGSQIRVECFGYEDRAEITMRALQASDDSLGDLMADECAAHLEGTLSFFESQIFSGVENDAKGFAGLQASVVSDMTIDAGSSVSGARTSVYMLFTGRTGVRFVCGKDSALKIGEIRREMITDANGKKSDGYVSPMSGWYGLMVGHQKCVGRISNIDASNPVTQKNLGQLLSKFPTNVRPNAIFMNRWAGEMWLDDRSQRGVLKSGNTKLSITGLYEDAKIDSFMGIPVYTTDGILSTE